MIICATKPIDPVVLVFAGFFLLMASLSIGFLIRLFYKYYKAETAPDPIAPETHDAYKGYRFKVTVVTLNDGTVCYFPVVHQPTDSPNEDSIILVDTDWPDGKTRVYHFFTEHYKDGKYSFRSKEGALAELNLYKLELIKKWGSIPRNIVEIVTT